MKFEANKDKKVNGDWPGLRLLEWIRKKNKKQDKEDKNNLGSSK